MIGKYSIIVPAYNEEEAIDAVLKGLFASELKEMIEVVVVDDCSSDKTGVIASKYPITLLKNVQNFGYGYSLKRGIKTAKNDNIIIFDADGSYPVEALVTLVETYEKGFDMVVGERRGAHYRGSTVKSVARFFFRLLSEFATGRKIPDINSGCRVFRKDLALNFFHTLSSGFSFTTTITLAFMLNAYSVVYAPIQYNKRSGSSKVRYLRDTLRSGQIIIEAIVFYNPLKMFLLCAAAIIIAGALALLLAFVSKVAALLLFLTLSFAILIFSIGLMAILVKSSKTH